MRVDEVLQDNARLTEENLRLREQVGKLIDSCWYRNDKRHVVWKQGPWFGVSESRTDSPEAYEQAMDAIRRNADCPEIEFTCGGLLLAMEDLLDACDGIPLQELVGEYNTVTPEWYIRILKAIAKCDEYRGVYE